MTGKNAMTSLRTTLVLLVVFLPPLFSSEKESAVGGNRILALEKRVEQLSEELATLKKGWEQGEPDAVNREPFFPEWVSNFSFGGYGELHGNFVEGSGADQFDIHRLVLYVGYQFNDWISFHSEAEIEHAYVSKDSGGELSLEQAHVDFNVLDNFGIRIGRVLTPIGIINKAHEPPRFYGVERPNFSKYIIPTTWSSDGAGVFGNFSDYLSYEAYVAGGLDGSGFSGSKGIREGRIKERPGFNEPAVTGRIDVHPFGVSDLPCGQSLRLGLSSYYGGLDNGNKGGNPGVDGDILMVSGDLQYAISRVDLRGVIAHGKIDRAEDLAGGIGSEIFGWYAELGVHAMPESLKAGKLKEADIVPFVRYEFYDTQHGTPSGMLKDQENKRQDWTFGINLYLTRDIVVKADCQVQENGSSANLPNLFNLGLGWQF